jgi:hypothetical protein
VEEEEEVLHQWRLDLVGDGLTQIYRGGGGRGSSRHFSTEEIGVLLSGGRGSSRHFSTEKLLYMQRDRPTSPLLGCTPTIRA